MSNTQLMEAGSTELQSLQDTSQIMLDQHAMERIENFGKMMAGGKTTVPKHLQGNVADCTAISMQAVQWGMNPFAVAQKTFMTPGGTLGYEGQLVNAVIIARAPIQARPSFEFIGDWSKILGKVKEMPSNDGKGKWYAADWNKKDEDGLGVIVTAYLIGEEEPRQVTVMMSQAYPRFSTQWATDPQQQITYLAIRKWARRYSPDVILGVYTQDELQEYQPAEKEINQSRPRTGAAAAEQAKSSTVINGDEDTRKALIKDLEETAVGYGLLKYGEAWLALSKQQRQLVGTTEHERIKKMADDSDKRIIDAEHVPGAD